MTPIRSDYNKMLDIILLKLITTPDAFKFKVRKIRKA